MGNVVRKEPCPKCREMGRDKSGDNLVIYEDDSAYCFACSHTILSEEEKERRGLNNYVYEETNMSEPLTKEQIKEIRDTTGNKGQNSRGITDETFRKYGVRFEYDEESGEVSSHFYPVTTNYEISGFKIREIPKKFRSVGQTGKSCDAFGEWIFKVSNSKTVVIAAGEVCCLSAYQMLENYRKSRNSDFEPTPVVSSTIGETGSDKQFQKRYNWLNRFDKIVICPDQDEAGKKAVEALVKVLPKNKVYVMELPMKDSNDMLTSGREKEWINAYFKAKQYTPAGIVSSEELYKEVVERAKVNKLPFPPMLEKANKVLAGGVNFGYICNIIAGSGSGKSSLINQCVKYWMTDLDMNVGVVSLEAEAGEFAENLLSHEMGRKIALIKDKEERISFVESEEAKQAAYNMFHRPDGSSRLFLLDDRGDFSMLQEKIEELIIACNCKIIVIDVISDILMPMPLDEVEKWMGWTKRIVKQYNCIFFHVSHVRKAGGGEKTASSGAFLTEESTIGSGSQFRSAGVNIALQRDKNNEDEVIRNTTSVHILKSRATGWTGKACELYYDSESHTLWDKDEYFSSRGGVFQ